MSFGSGFSGFSGFSGSGFSGFGSSIGSGLGGLSNVFARVPLGIQTDSFVWPFIGGIIGLLFLILVIYMIVQYYTTGVKNLITGPVNLYAPVSPLVVDRATTTKSMVGSYTLAFYVHLDSVPDMRADTPLFTWPGVWNMSYNPANEQMIWTFSQTNSAEKEIVVLPRVPLQRWVQIVIGFEGRSVDLYVNGALVKSDILNNLPSAGNASVTIVPNGIMGKLAHVQLWPRRLLIKEVAADYTETSDSQGRPFLGPGLFDVFTGFKLPNLFCPNGDCTGSKPACSGSQTWEFPYA